jgi:hypothetical protein
MDGNVKQEGCPGPRLGPHNVAVMDTPQFPPAANDAYTGSPNDAYEWEPASFVYHTQEGWEGGRQKVLRRHLGLLGISSAEAFSAAVGEIQSTTIDIVEIALAMHAETCVEKAACAAAT